MTGRENVGSLGYHSGTPIRNTDSEGIGRVGEEPRSSLYRLLMGGPDRIGGASLRWRNSMRGRLRGQRFCGACRSEGLIGGEHVPDRLGQPAGQVDPGDLRPALLAQAGPGPLVALGVDRMAGGVRGRLDQRPAQVLRPVLGQRGPVVAAAGLVDRRTQPSFFGLSKRVMSPISAAMVYPSTAPMPGTVLSKGT
jgi:hypothetical protein